MAVVGYVALGKISPFLCASADASLARRATDFSLKDCPEAGRFPKIPAMLLEKQCYR